jgi:hypothetical protein
MKGKSLHLRSPGFLGSIFVPIFDPTTIAGLSLWVKGDTGITLNGSKVSAWADQSGNGKNLIQNTAGNQPTYLASAKNGKPGVRFTIAATSFMSTSNFASAIAHPMIFIVYTQTQVVAGNQEYVFDAGGGDRVQMNKNQNNRTAMYAGAQIQINETYPLSWRIRVCSFNGSSGAMYTNGVQNIAGNVGNQTMPNFVLGRWAGGSAYSEFDVAEILIYNSILSDSDRNNVEGYLNRRYAIF